MPKSHVFGDLVLANITSFNENMLGVQRSASDNSSEAKRCTHPFPLFFCAYFLHDMEVPQSCQLLLYMFTLDLFHLHSFLRTFFTRFARNKDDLMKISKSPMYPMYQSNISIRFWQVRLESFLETRYKSIQLRCS